MVDLLRSSSLSLTKLTNFFYHTKNRKIPHPRNQAIATDAGPHSHARPTFSVSWLESLIIGPLPRFPNIKK